MFVDVAKIQVKAGNGGDGHVSFHREKYVPSGGPDGGDGGRGANIIFQADKSLSTLVDFRYKRKYAASNGEHGGKKRCSGKKGNDLVIRVPFGTLVFDDVSGQLIADLSNEQPVVVAKGGSGGWGNSHFATPTRQAPRFAKPGMPGESLELRLELKLLADVGLVGFPNVGKSTLISSVSAAKPKIANYHFTTLTPVLGVVRVEEGQSFVLADIPGLIEGASGGAGLGHAFLRHIERCRLILHVVDVSGSEGRDPIEDFNRINEELQKFNPQLGKLPQLVAANKCDLANPEQVERFTNYVTQKGYACYQISAATTQGVQALMKKTAQKLAALPPIKEYQPNYVPPQSEKADRTFAIRQQDGVYYIDAPWIENILRSVSMEDYESLLYFQRVLRESGIVDRLEDMGVTQGDTIDINGWQFDYLD